MLSAQPARTRHSHTALTSILQSQWSENQRVGIASAVTPYHAPNLSCKKRRCLLDATPLNERDALHATHAKAGICIKNMCRGRAKHTEKKQWGKNLAGKEGSQRGEEDWVGGRGLSFQGWRGGQSEKALHPLTEDVKLTCVHGKVHTHT